MTPRRLDSAVIHERLREIQLLLGRRYRTGAIPLAREQFGQYVQQIARWLRGNSPDIS